ncbi:hypothetical protein K458DRAFT_411500 [Lentithecium fluviatile CBS 122367]|uniref:Uncharacterized protein n=1 Tax=Lentithecium fluviatile CBS 122367 TaxID=1168545 RepID=A0A6G1JNQ5_9PLEO|nr:hypothetical protein K458DRAFT_411500 [Lentithecium fluviatile CBS 122367]
MQFFITLSGLIAIASTAAIPRPVPSTVTLRLITSLAHESHYTPTQQVPTIPKGNTLHILVGQALSLDQSPLYLQAIEIAEITKGVALTSPPQQVTEGDNRVKCMVKTGHSSSGLAFGLEAGVVAFGGETGGLATVTGVECWLNEEYERVTVWDA